MTPDPDDPVEVFRGQWAMEIGRFVMAFGTIEGVTYSALRHLPLDPIAAPLADANLQLGARLNLLIAICNSRDGERWARLSKALGQIKTLSGQRNLIAHNSVGMGVYHDAEGRTLFTEGIRNMRKPAEWNGQPTDKDLMQFEALVKHRKQAEALAVELVNAHYLVIELIGAAKNGDTEFVEQHKNT